MLPPNSLTHYLSTISNFPVKKLDFKGICQKSKNPVFIKNCFPICHQNSNIHVFLKRDVLFVEKKTPGRAAPPQRLVLGYTHTWVYPYLGNPTLGYTHTWVTPSLGIPILGYTHTWVTPCLGIPILG